MRFEGRPASSIVSLALLSVGAGAAWMGCDAVAGIHDGELAAGDGGAQSVDGAGADSPAPGKDATTGDDAPADGPRGDAIADAGLDAPPEVATTWHDMANPTYWSTFDTSAVDGGGSGCEGAAFDGRYVYLSCGTVERFDTQGSFGSASSWTTYPTGQTAGGALFDGRYVYFVSDVVTRYDTQAAFGTASSWASFSVPGLSGASLQGATFDGRYVYFAGATTARYDTTAPFTSATSWSTFSTGLLLCSDSQYVGAVFDGRFVYFSPHSAGCVARYDTQGPYANETSWDTFDTTTFDSTAEAYYGAAFDGRYVYFPQAPNFGSGPANLAVRYDTQVGFGVASSWSTFDTGGLGTNPGSYTASGFDGRYVYFLQGYAGGAPGFIARYDTTGVFAAGDAGLDGGAWEGLSTAAFNTLAWDFHGAVYDGRYLYLAPNFNAVAARLDTKTPAWMPGLPDFHGSFY